MQIDSQSSAAASALEKALEASRLEARRTVSGPLEAGDTRPSSGSPVEEAPEKPAFTLEISDEARAQVRQLQQRDNEVRAHENAHASAGGALAGAPSYEYQLGPDGRRYAVGGEVSIQVQEGATPEETLRIADQVRTAALAPSQPSAADLGVAASATSLELKARRELAEERTAELTGASTDAATDAATEPAGVAPASESHPADDPRVQNYGQAPEADLLGQVSYFA